VAAIVGPSTAAKMVGASTIDCDHIATVVVRSDFQDYMDPAGLYNYIRAQTCFGLVTSEIAFGLDGFEFVERTQGFDPKP
jgi:hypothetical protein